MPVYRAGLEHSLFEDLDSMGYPKLPVTMLDGESVLLDLPTFCASRLFTALLYH